MAFPVLYFLGRQRFRQGSEPFGVVFHRDDMRRFFTKKQGGTAAAKLKNPKIGAEMAAQKIQGGKRDPGLFVGHRTAARTK